MSLFLLKNSFGSKMKKGFRNFCNGESSTSTLDQHKLDLCAAGEQNPPVTSPSRDIIQPRRMSCVNSSDILRTARSALDQYPIRFSLDGKDAMYRSSFANSYATEAEKSRRSSLPCVIGGESVIWCRAGVVPKLMGLDAMPIPLNSISCRRERLSANIRKQNLRKRAERLERERERERERRKVMADKRREVVGCCSRSGYCIMKPIDLEIPIRRSL